MITQLTKKEIKAKNIGSIVDLIKNRYQNIYLATNELGFCIIAKRDIKPGEFICKFEGNTINYQDTILKGDFECMPLQYGTDKYIDSQPPAVFLNHSCDPNCGLFGFQIRAIKTIKKNQEITFDYSTTIDDGFKMHDCKCGQKRCRKVISNFKDCPIEIKNEYLKKGIVMDYLK